MEMDLGQQQKVAKKTMKKKRNIAPYLFVLPWFFGFAAFILGPLLLSLYMSFHDWPVIGERTFVGFGNYIQMFTQDPMFYDSLKISFKFAAFFVPFNIGLALLLAFLISSNAKGVRLFRVIFYLPNALSGVAISIIWGWILNSKYGVLNYLLSLIGIDGPNWLTDPDWALIALVMASAWTVGNMMIIFYTDIKQIPKDYYEAATLDGASPMRQFFSITLPIITPTILFNIVTSIITALQQLTLVMLLTNGGPLRSTYMYGLYVYENAFRHHELGYAAANAWVMFIIILLLTLLILRSSSVWVYYENNAKPNVRKKKRKKAKQ